MNAQRTEKDMLGEKDLPADEFDRLISAEAVMCLGRRKEAW